MFISVPKLAPIVVPASASAKAVEADGGISPGTPPPLLINELVTIVRASKGKSFFFVSRIDADVACVAERNARCNEESGTSRLITLFAADWIVY